MGWGQCEIIICKWALSPVVIRHFGVVQRVELIKSGRSHWTWAIGTYSSAASASCARLLRFAGKSQFAILLPLLHCHSNFPFLSGPKAPTQTKTTAAAGVLLFLLASALFVCCLFSLLSAFALHFSALSFFAFRSCQRTKRAKLWAERAHMLVFVFFLQAAHPHMHSQTTTNDAGQKFWIENATNADRKTKWTARGEVSLTTEWYSDLYSVAQRRC